MNAARKPNEAERVELMLCVLPWIVSQGGASLAEIGEHFAADPELIRRDLNTVFVEVELGDPGTMVDVDISDDDWVDVHLPGSFEEPPDLDHAEALHLLAAGTAMAAVEGASDALDPALDKLASVLGEGARGALRVDLGSGDPRIRELLRTASRERRQLRLRYFSWGADTVGDRTVDPYALRSVAGEWYLTAHCHDRGALRHFRLDRVLSAEPIGDPGAFEVPEVVPAPLEDFHPEDSGAEVREVELDIPASAAWVVDSLPVRDWSETEEGERIVLLMGVTSDTWLDRVLLRLPPDSRATDITSGDDLMQRRTAAAARILDRHGEPADSVTRSGGTSDAR